MDTWRKCWCKGSEVGASWNSVSSIFLCCWATATNSKRLHIWPVPRNASATWHQRTANMWGNSNPATATKLIKLNWAILCGGIYHCWSGIISLWYHSDLYTMQEPSYLGKFCLHINMLQSSIDTNDNSGTQRFSHLDIPSKSNTWLVLQFWCPRVGFLIPSLLLTIDTMHSPIYQPNTSMYVYLHIMISCYETVHRIL